MKWKSLSGAKANTMNILPVDEVEITTGMMSYGVKKVQEGGTNFSGAKANTEVSSYWGGLYTYDRDKGKDSATY
jgi:hypothetical protein